MMPPRSMATIGKNSRLKTFEKLYFENYNLLCRSVYRFVKDEETSKDIVQEVFIKYWNRMHEMHIRESEIAYLQKSCINAALNYLKEVSRRKTRELSFTESSSKGASRPDDSFQTEETSKQIDSTIEQLPPTCREVFILSRYESKSYREIAEILDVSVNTVEKHIGKALKRLREVLKRPN
jgi:RNA polymerase sigma-70 factor (ECF subfamily)